MQRLTAFSIALVVALATSAHAEERDTARGIVGSTLCIQFRLDTAKDLCPITALLRLSNPTVWYPTTLQLGTSQVRLEQVRDTLWRIEGTLEPGNEAVAQLCGIVLAGTDSICVVMIDSLLICATLQPSQQHVVLARSIGPPLPYVRFARLEGPYPFPTSRGAPFELYVGLDAPSRVAIRLYDLIGRLVLDFSEYYDRGTHRIELRLPDGTAPGIYALRMESTTGSAVSLVIVE